MRVRRWESKILRLTLRPRMKASEEWVEYRKRTSWEMRAKWRKMRLPTMVDKNVEKVWKAVAWANYDGDVPVVKALRSILRWRTTTWWRKRSAWSMRVGPMNVSRWKHQWRFPQQRRALGYSMAKWAGEGKDWAQEMTMHPPRKDEVIKAFLKMTRRPTERLLKKVTEKPNQKNKGTGSYVS